jgi:hypothetical protein
MQCAAGRGEVIPEVRAIEQVRQRRVIKDAPASAISHRTYERAACRAPIDYACSIAAGTANRHDARAGNEKTINQGRSVPHREGTNCEAQLLAEAATTSKGLRSRLTNGCIRTRSGVARRNIALHPLLDFRLKFKQQGFSSLSKVI